MPETANEPSERHLLYLDSARGIAALMVFGSHFVDKELHRNIVEKYLNFIFNGSSAVSFFFVLSGFVLSYKYIILNKTLDFRKFYVNRIFRLFPAFFITVILAVIFRLRNEMSLTNLADVFIFNKTQFWEEVFMLRFHHLYFGPGWTLTIELLVSFMMPFFIILALKDKRIITYLYVVFLIIGSNLFFSTHFLLGTIICCNYLIITGSSFRKTKWFQYRYIIILVAVFLFSVWRIDEMSPFGPTYLYLANYFGIDFYLYSGWASFVFIIAIIQSKKAQRFLETRVLLYIGKISYGIYLTHTLGLGLAFAYIPNLIHSSDQNIIIPALIISSLICTLLLATLMHYIVELPSMRWGKRITKKMRPSLVFERGS